MAQQQLLSKPCCSRPGRACRNWICQAAAGWEALQRLTALHIKHCHRVTEEGVQQLSVLSGLQELSYGYTSMPEANDVAAAIAGQFKQLTALDLLASELTDQGLAALSSLQQLQKLKLYQAAVSVDALQQLAGQPGGRGLTCLVLYGLGRLTQLECLGAFPQLLELQLGGLCHLASASQAVQQLALLPRLQRLTLERINGLLEECLQQMMAGSSSLLCLRVRGCDGVCEEDMQELAEGAASRCSSSASVWWAASPSCDTDDEEDGWELLPV
ncbi:hypothetical protein OEZ85_009503 [Tetradesmus obliquus]|uniref:Uncharacterized protein n=1 Tax=Tetradesmus obliquus TaxID=3088 RepID=A0ABY8UCB7_TETOB|nr:hypothetical protein OEZ85_009503 [Tetradesmus obliquus]